MKRLFSTLVRANLYSLVIAFKILALVVWQLIDHESHDLFGIYSLCLGLTSTFFIVSGMRSRVYVLGGINSFIDLLSLTKIMMLLGLLSVGSVTLLYFDHDYLTILMLVSSCKLAENFLDANTSYIQKTLGRLPAYSILNVHSIILIFAFVSGLIMGGLEYALLAELLVLIFTLLRQMIVLKSRPEPENRVSYGFMRVLWNGSELTFAAGLNSAIVTGFLYWGSFNMPESDILAIAKILAIQGYCARLITGNNIFFFKEIVKSEVLVARIANGATLIGLLICSVLLLYTEYFGNWSKIGTLYAFGVASTVLNIVNITIRQQLLLTGTVRPLIIVHSLELIFLSTVFALLTPASKIAFLVFTLVRFFRNLYLIRLFSSLG